MPPYGVVRGRRTYTEPTGRHEYNAKGRITSHPPSPNASSRSPITCHERAWRRTRIAMTPREWSHLLHHQGSLQNLSFSCVTWTCFQKWLCMAIAPEQHERYQSTSPGKWWHLPVILMFHSWGWESGVERLACRLGYSLSHLCDSCLGWPFYSERQCFEICLFNKFSVLITGQLKTKTLHSSLWRFFQAKFWESLNEEWTWPQKKSMGSTT